nr:MAG TPA: hypothetical protein [Caudoviricetes sp.]DAX26271.1 MAG TPA: hypothetical protein [Caudoviricetes sp.]
MIPRRVHLVNDSDKTTWYNKIIHRNINFFLFLLYPIKSDEYVHIYKVVHSYSQLFTDLFLF